MAPLRMGLSLAAALALKGPTKISKASPCRGNPFLSASFSRLEETLLMMESIHNSFQHFIDKARTTTWSNPKKQAQMFNLHLGSKIEKN